MPAVATLRFPDHLGAGDTTDVWKRSMSRVDDARTALRKTRLPAPGNCRLPRDEETHCGRCSPTPVRPLQLDPQLAFVSTRTPLSLSRPPWVNCRQGWGIGGCAWLA